MTPGRALIARTGESERGGQGRVGGAADHRRWPSVRGGVGDGAESDDETDAEAFDGGEDTVDVGRPGDVRFDAIEDDEVALALRSADDAHDVPRPHDPSLTVHVLDRRARHGEVVEGIGVDLADDHAVRLVGDVTQRCRGHTGGVEPAAEGDEQRRVGQHRRVVDGQDEVVSHWPVSPATQRRAAPAEEGGDPVTARAALRARSRGGRCRR